MRSGCPEENVGEVHEAAGKSINMSVVVSIYYVLLSLT
jgi:hypothetical protein